MRSAIVGLIRWCHSLLGVLTGDDGGDLSVAILDDLKDDKIGQT
jgi:hypothetical protein